MGRNEIVWAIAEALVFEYGDSLAENDLHLKMAQRVYNRLRRYKAAGGEPLLNVGRCDIPKKNLHALNQGLKNKLGFEDQT